MKSSTANVLIDASVLIAYYNTDDLFHSRAKELADRLDSAAQFISEHVLDETLSVIARKAGKRYAIDAGENIRNSAITVLYSDEEFTEQTWDVYCEDNAFSYTDAHQAALLQTGSFTAIATFDEEFSRIGFPVID